jgi:GAF domain-containing protein
LTGQSLHESLIEALASFLPDLELISKIVLENAKQVTGSRHGFVGTIDEDTKALVIQTFKVEEKCLVKEKKSVFYPDENGRYSGLFGYALNEKTAFYTNSPKAHPASKGTPEGHVPIERFMAVPVALGGKLLGLIALANPEKDYTEEDLEKVKTIAKYFAIALEHYRIENKLRTIASLYETLVEDVPLPTLVIEEDDTVSYVNSAFEELTGYSKNEVIGKMKWHQFGQKPWNTRGEDLKGLQHHQYMNIRSSVKVEKYMT